MRLSETMGFQHVLTRCSCQTNAPTNLHNRLRQPTQFTIFTRTDTCHTSEGACGSGWNSIKSRRCCSGVTWGIVALQPTQSSPANTWLEKLETWFYVLSLVDALNASGTRGCLNYPLLLGIMEWIALINDILFHHSPYYKATFMRP